MLGQQSSRPPTTPDHPADPGGVVSLQNGLLDVAERLLIPHRLDYFTHHALGFAYDPDAPNRRVARLPGRTLAGRRGVDPVLQEIIGYVLAGDTSLQKIFLLVGPPRSGKGTILGSSRACWVITTSPGRRSSSLTQNFGLSPLIGKPSASISDARLGAGRTARSLSSGSCPSRARTRSPSTGSTATRGRARSPTRFVIVTNEVPAFSRRPRRAGERFIILDADQELSRAEDPGLTNRALEERPGTSPGRSRASTDSASAATSRCHRPALGRSAILRISPAPVSAFVREECTVGGGLQVDKDDLWDRWKTWAGEEGMPDGNQGRVLPRPARRGARFQAATAPRRRRPETHLGRRRPAISSGWSGIESIVSSAEQVEIARLLRAPRPGRGRRVSRAGNSTVPRRPPAQLPLFTVAPPAEPAGVAVAVRADPQRVAPRRDSPHAARALLPGGNRGEAVSGAYLTCAQLAAVYAVTPRTVRRWEAAGVLPPAVRLPGTRSPRWRRADLELHMLAHRHAPPRARARVSSSASGRMLTTACGMLRDPRRGGQREGSRDRGAQRRVQGAGLRWWASLVAGLPDA